MNNNEKALKMRREYWKHLGNIGKLIDFLFLTLIEEIIACQFMSVKQDADLTAKIQKFRKDFHDFRMKDMGDVMSENLYGRHITKPTEDYNLLIGESNNNELIEFSGDDEYLYIKIKRPELLEGHAGYRHQE